MPHRLLVCALLGVATLAHAEPEGLSAEAGTRVDDMTIRRVRDTSNGVVCYVASSYAYSVAPRGRTVAIDCVQEAK